jgi:anti-sigma-K factor RskA
MTTPVSPPTETPVTMPPVTSAPGRSAQSAGNRSSDNQRFAELAAENEKLKEENTALSAVSAATNQRVADLQAALTAAQSRSDALTRDLEAAKSSPQSGSQSEIAALTSQLSDSRAEVERLNQIKARGAQLESLLQSGSVQEIELRAVDPAAGRAFARVLYSPQGGLLLVANSLPKLDHEKCYQLWLIRKGAPAILSAGLLQTSEDGRGFLMVQPTNDLAQLTGLAITDEPKGGSVSARGHKLLFGAR